MSDENNSPGTGDQNLDFETDYELGQDNVNPMGLDIHNPVFAISSILIVGFVLLSLANQEASAALFGWLRPWLTSTFDWFLGQNFYFNFCLFLFWHGKLSCQLFLFF